MPNKRKSAVTYIGSLNSKLQYARRNRGNSSPAMISSQRGVSSETPSGIPEVNQQRNRVVLGKNAENRINAVLMFYLLLLLLSYYSLSGSGCQVFLFLRSINKRQLVLFAINLDCLPIASDCMGSVFNSIFIPTFFIN